MSRLLLTVATALLAVTTTSAEEIRRFVSLPSKGSYSAVPLDDINKVKLDTSFAPMPDGCSLELVRELDTHYITAKYRGAERKLYSLGMVDTKSPGVGFETRGVVLPAEPLSSRRSKRYLLIQEEPGDVNEATAEFMRRAAVCVLSVDGTKYALSRPQHLAWSITFDRNIQSPAIKSAGLVSRSVARLGMVTVKSGGSAAVGTDSIVQKVTYRDGLLRSSFILKNDLLGDFRLTYDTLNSREAVADGMKDARGRRTALSAIEFIRREMGKIEGTDIDTEVLATNGKDQFVLATTGQLLYDSPHCHIVTDVIDGDTIKVAEVRSMPVDKRASIGYGAGRVTVRIRDIDAPELSQPYGEAARDKLSSVLGLDLVENLSPEERAIAGRPLVMLSNTGFDRYGRTLANVKPVGDMDTVSKQMVSSGMAWHYKQYSKDESLADLEDKAREAGVGVWMSDSPVAPWDYRKNKRDSVKPVRKPLLKGFTKRETGELTHWLTTSTGVRHRPGCRYFDNTSGTKCRSSDGKPCKVCGG